MCMNKDAIRSKLKTNLIIEQWPHGEGHWQSLCAIQTTSDKYIGIIDNHDDKFISMYHTQPMTKNREVMGQFFDMVNMWIQDDRRIPLSIVISRNGLMPIMCSYHITLYLEDVRRIVGPSVYYAMDNTQYYNTVGRKKPKTPSKRKVKKMTESTIDYNGRYVFN